jgi:hypothetical protein
MTVYLSLSAPEHSHLIVNYHDIFPEHNTFKMIWDCGAIPRPGDILDFSFITDLVGDKLNIAMLPKVWQVMDIRWTRETEGIIPVLNVVGK